jgi:hypothetical protein
MFPSLKLLSLFLFKLVPYLGVVHLLCVRSPYVDDPQARDEFKQSGNGSKADVWGMH